MDNGGVPGRPVAGAVQPAAALASAGEWRPWIDTATGARSWWLVKVCPSSGWETWISADDYTSAMCFGINANLPGRVEAAAEMVRQLQTLCHNAGTR